MRAGFGSDHPSHRRRAGEADPLDQRMLDDHVADGGDILARAGDDVKDARRDPGGFENFGEYHAARIGCLLGRLQHHAVARGDREREAARRQQGREIPGRDHCYDTHRTAHCQRYLAMVRRQHLANGVVGHRGGGAEHLRHIA